MTIEGKCLCGAVRLEVSRELEHAPQACHCSQCRKQTGHFLVGVNVRRSDLQIQGSDKITWYQSSDKVQRGFCSVCGSTLFWNPNIEGYEYIAIAMGLFDSPTGARIAKHTFVGDKGDYYEITDDAPQSEGF